MGRTPARSGVDEASLLFPAEELPLSSRPQEGNFLSLRHPVWTEDKARLIQTYLQLFIYITKHGTYIDGFAAPQRRDLTELCSARLVLETDPKWMRDFWLCDLDPSGVEILEALPLAPIEHSVLLEMAQGCERCLKDAVGGSRWEVAFGLCRTQLAFEAEADVEVFTLWTWVHAFSSTAEKARASREGAFMALHAGLRQGACLTA